MEERVIPTKSQIEVLMSDWLGNSRDDKTFIHKDTKGTIKRTIREDGNYSDYFLGDISSMPQEDILRQAREISQGVVNGMTDRNIRVQLGSSDSFTNGYDINVATDYFDDKSLSVGQKIDILTGYSIHEACHINHSDFGALSRVTDKEPEIAELKKNLMNILEDERIEHLLGESLENGGDGMPGLSDYLGCCKKHTFGNYEKNLKKENVELTSRVPAFLNALLKAVRYPAALTEKEVTVNFEELDKVRKVLMPFPKSTTGMEAAADRIVDIMRDMVKKDMQNKKQQEQGQQQNQNDNSDNSQQQSSNGGQDNQQSPNQGSQSSQGGNTPEPTKKEVEQALKNALGEQNTKKLMEQIKKSMDQSKAGSDKNANCLNGYRNDKIKEFVNGESEKAEGAGGRNEIVFVRKVKGNRDAYQTSLRSVKKWVPAMAKALRCKTLDRDYELMGMKSGKLNTNKLVSLKTGNTRVFTKSGSITTDSACICILIDESGSMKNGGRLKGARDTAVLVNEAVSHIPNLELFVYGYTDNELNIYCERRKADRWAIGSTKATGGTPTAAAMEVASKRIRKMTANNCLMLVITDGCPNDREATIEQDLLLPKKGFVPVGVDIGGANQVSGIFKEAISTSDMNRLAPYLGQIVRKRLGKTIHSYDSM